jgi:hypothetical protein
MGYCRDLKNNDELYRYLLSLAHELKHLGKSHASFGVALASQLAFGSPSEFLHEAMTALASVQRECKDVLTEAQLANLESAIAQIEIAFQRVGGA